MRHKFDCIFDQFGEEYNFCVAQFRKLTAGGGVGLPGLVKLDGIGLASNLFTVPPAILVVVNPPTGASFWILIDPAHHDCLRWLSSRTRSYRESDKQPSHMSQ